MPIRFDMIGLFVNDLFDAALRQRSVCMISASAEVMQTSLLPNLLLCGPCELERVKACPAQTLMQS